MCYGEGADAYVDGNARRLAVRRPGRGKPPVARPRRILLRLMGLGYTRSRPGHSPPGKPGAETRIVTTRGAMEMFV